MTEIKETERSMQEINPEATNVEELRMLKGKITDVSEYFKKVLKGMSSDIEDIKYDIPTENTLQIGKDSVRPLIDLKTSTCEVFANVRNSEVRLLQEELDVEPYKNHIEGLKAQLRDSKQLIHYLKLTSEAMMKLLEQQKKQKKGNSGESSVSSVETASSEISISDFSLFNSNVATSSPISKFNESKKEP